MLTFSALLPLCERLEELTLRPFLFEEGLQMYEGAKQLVSHMCCLPAPLARLHILADSFLTEEQGEAMDELLALVARFAPYGSLTLDLSDWSGWDPPDADLLPEQNVGRESGVPWCLAPQLHALSLQIDSDEVLSVVSAGLPQLTQLRTLEVLQWPDDVAAPSLPGLERMPQLRSLYTQRFLPPQAWLCPHLTALRCVRNNDGPAGPPIPAPSAGAVACTALLRLHLSGCRLPGGPHSMQVFPSELCTLRQLTSLGVVAMWSAQGKSFPPLTLPACFSKLSSLRHLSFEGTHLNEATLAALCPLSRLTALSLSGCKQRFLPHGPYLAGLVSLDLSFNEFDSPLPFLITAASNLRALSIDTRTDSANWNLEEQWPNVHTRLLFLRKLQVLLLNNWDCDTHWVSDKASDGIQALVTRLGEAFGTLEVTLCDELSDHPAFCQPEWDTISCGPGE